MSTADHLRTVVESFTALVEGHFRLFKLELAEDAKVVGVQVGKIVAFVPLIIVGYAFLCAALAMFLQRWLAADVSYLIVGGLNVVGGALGILLAAKTLQKRQLLEGTRREARATTAAITHAVTDPAITVQVTNG